MVSENKVNPAIQSLRGIAILGVLAFHFQISGFELGFLGVDVFFVISGYLITKKVWGINSTRLYLIYLKSRAKRILPSYSVVLFSVITLAWFTAGPNELLGYLGEVKAAVTFTSNYYYFENTGYFDNNALYQPLLHFWSLAVEIQFYILFPILVTIVLKKKIYKFHGALLIFYLLSIFLGNQYGEMFAFYDVNSRVWQFLAGSSLAAILAKKTSNLHSSYALIGFASLTILMDTSNLVIILTIIFIYSAETAKITFPQLQKIGNYSYEIYLWHWPVISFYSAHRGFPNTIMTVVLLVTTLILAYLTQRVTTRSYGRPKFSRLIYPYGMVVVILLAASVGFLENPRINKVKEIERFMVKNSSGDFKSNFSKCKLTKTYRQVEQFCQESGSIDSDQEIVLWGDSTAESWAHAFELSNFSSKRIVLFSIPACAPLVDSYRADRSFGSEWCKTPKLQNSIFEYIKELKPSHLFLIARWSLYTDGLVENGKVIEEKFYSKNHSPGDKESTLSRIRKSSEIIASELGGTEITIFQDAWILDETPIEAINREGNFTNLKISTKEYSRDSKETKLEIKDISIRLKWKMIDPAANLCKNDMCQVIVNNHVLFADKVHVTRYGAESLSVFLP